MIAEYFYCLLVLYSLKDDHDRLIILHI